MLVWIELLRQIGVLNQGKHASKTFQEALPNAYRHFTEVFITDLNKFIASINPLKDKGILDAGKQEKQGHKTAPGMGL